MARPLKGFEYFEPSSVEETIRILGTHRAGTKIIAGGVDLIGKMRLRKMQPQYVVSIMSIPGLSNIKSDEVSLEFGASTTLISLELMLKDDETYPALYEAISQLTSIQVKNMATAVGNLCVATPASDIACALCALGATIQINGTCTERTVPIEEFYLGVGRTVLQPDEIVTRVIVPRPTPKSGNAFLNLLRTKCDIAKVSVAVNLIAANGRCKDIRIALGSVAPTIVRAREAEDKVLQENSFEKVVEEAAQTAAMGVTPIDDVRSTAEYRREMVKVLVKQALRKAWARANA